MEVVDANGGLEGWTTEGVGYAGVWRSGIKGAGVDACGTESGDGVAKGNTVS